jgi:hypothetical protein
MQMLLSFAAAQHLTSLSMVVEIILLFCAITDFFFS